jgi:S-DNA-T family DNA segregation ATPase FtsK/SpoIIIE
VLVGIAVFLFVALYGGEAAGSAGRGVRTALVYAFGALAFLFPLCLVAIAAKIVFRVRSWNWQRWVGVALFVFGLFLLVGAGGPPFDSHGPAEFVRGDFERLAGGLGEAVHAGFHRAVGSVGVGIVGWVAGLVGIILTTGVSGSWLRERAMRATEALKRVLEQESRAGMPGSGGSVRRNDSIYPATRPGGFREPAGERVEGGRPQLQLGPVDLVAGAEAASDETGVGARSHTVFGDAFDEWGTGRSSRSPVEWRPATRGAEEQRGVVDGARAFSDIYERKTAADSGTAEVGERLPATDTLETAVREGTEVGAGDATAETVETPGLGQELGMGPAYLLPESAVLRKSARTRAARGSAEDEVAAVLVDALSQFGVEARVIGTVVGPRVTRYELQLAPGTKVAKVTALRDDLAYALASTEIRILAPIPGKSAVGVEVPNQRPDFVTLGDIYREFPKSSGPLMVWLGKDISGKAIYADLTKLPHLLIAGTTGSGKSGCVNCIVSSVLLRSTPDQVRMIMIDPKKVELSHYDRIPHLLVPVVTNMKDAAGVLHNVVKEMEARYELLELDHARSLAEANKTRAQRGERALPYFLIVIDELADLMMASPQEVEDYVIRLAQKSRAVGIHLVLATQRPSADVITGMIKANIPSRIAFAVSSQTDSRVILDVNGAETLLGMGDMLFKPLGSSHLQRVQGAYITEEEIERLVSHWRRQAEPEFREELLRHPDRERKSEDSGGDTDSDDLLVDAARLVMETGSASVSMLQRRLRVGYTRAGRLIDMLERRGIVGPWEGSKPRQILVSPGQVPHVLGALELEGSGAESKRPE